MRRGCPIVVTIVVIVLATVMAMAMATSAPCQMLESGANVLRTMLGTRAECLAAKTHLLHNRNSGLALACIPGTRRVDENNRTDKLYNDCVGLMCVVRL